MRKESSTSIFTDMLLALLEGDNSLPDSLFILSRQGMSPSIRETSIRILDIMRRGQSFSKAITAVSEEKKSGIYFSSLYISLIAAAETTGTLVPVLRDINSDFQRKKTNRDLFYSALIYPGAIVLIAFIGTLFVLFMGLPFFITTGMIVESSINSMIIGIIFAGLFLSISGMVLFYICNRYFGNESVEFRIFYMLSFLLRGQIPLATALSQCIAAIGESKAGRALVIIKRDICSGVPISRAFENTLFFSPFVIGWLTIADERSGAVYVFSSLTDHFKKKDQHRRDILSRLIEPTVIIITGIYILILVKTIILPILTRAGGF